MSVDPSRDDVPTTTHDDATHDDESTYDDDAALSWGSGSSDPSYLETPVDESAVTAEPDVDDDDELPEGVMSSRMLIVHGVAGGLFLLFTIAWVKSIGGVAPSFDSAIASTMWTIGTWLAVAGPALWFVGTILLTPVGAGRARVVSFVVGLVILLPWPFVIAMLS